MNPGLWLRPGNWAALRERSLLREWLGLRIWHRLSEPERDSDHSEPLQRVTDAVLACETGADPTAGGPWDALETMVRVRLHQLHAQLILRAAPQPVSTALASARAQLLQQRRELRRQLIAETRYGEFPYEQLREALPMLAAFFLLSSYLIVATYFAHFGIRVSRFFSLWDYVGSSMDALRGLSMSLGLAGIAMLVAFRRMKLHMLQQKLRVRISVSLLQWLGLLGLAAVSLHSYYQSIPDYLTLAFATVMYFSGVIAPKLAIVFSKPLRAIFVMSFLTMYSLTVLATIDASIAMASRPFEPDELLYQVSFADGKDDATYRVLAGNSLWLFLQDEKLQVQMVPIEQIRSVRKLPGTVEHP